MEQAWPQGNPGSPWPGCSFPARHAQAEGNGPGEAVWEGVMSQKASSVDVGEPRFPLLGLSFPTRNNSWSDNLCRLWPHIPVLQFKGFRAALW